MKKNQQILFQWGRATRGNARVIKAHLLHGIRFNGGALREVTRVQPPLQWNSQSGFNGGALREVTRGEFVLDVGLAYVSMGARYASNAR